MFDISENYKIARNLASGGMILLKNEDGTLPLTPNRRIGIVGKECLDLIGGGGGSSLVVCEYIRSLAYGLKEKSDAGKFVFFEDSVRIAEQTEQYTVDMLSRMAQDVDSVVVAFKRNSAEGRDRVIGENVTAALEIGAYAGETDDTVKATDADKARGFYYPSREELELFKCIEESKIENVILILNISSIVDISFINKFKKIKAVLLTYLPGMESGTAIADILSGDVNPSGRLTDTIAYDIYDYPSTKYFDYDENTTEYKEGVFVGYRYFETYAKEKVLYPFGYGLSYTDYKYDNFGLNICDGKVCATLDVKNTGAVSGREVVQIYTSSPKGALVKPAIELRAYKKTGSIMPNGSESLNIEFNISDVASFDSTGATGYKGSYVLEKGEYKVFVGKNARELFEIGTFNIEETKPVKTLSCVFDNDCPNPQFNVLKTEKSDISLYDVADGKATLDEFIATLSSDELIELAMGQPPSFPRGTAGIGNLKKHGVPNVQTADGPAGVRRSINSTCFPCETLIASSFDSELQYQMGKVMGREGYSTDLDVLLAPGLNIHRNPLCGRNFEYFSEDPLVAGVSGANIVNGIQSEGLLATIKHFTANNCEYMRRSNNSVVDERTLREIYLKPFEIAVKNSNPAYIMTSYNKVNGHHSSANSRLLRTVLREEWGYEGAIMTDWRTFADMDDEIIAGNNIKMPFGYPDQVELCKKSYESGKVSLAQLQENAKWVLLSVMRSRAFKKRDFGFKNTVQNGSLTVPAIRTDAISSTRVMQKKLDNGEWCLYSIDIDQRGLRTFIIYSVECEEAGDYILTANVISDNESFEIWCSDEDETFVKVLNCSSNNAQNGFVRPSVTVPLKKGNNLLKFTFAKEPDKTYEPTPKGVFIAIQNVSLGFAGFSLQLKNDTEE